MSLLKDIIKGLALMTIVWIVSAVSFHFIDAEYTKVMNLRELNMAKAGAVAQVTLLIFYQLKAVNRYKNSDGKIDDPKKQVEKNPVRK